MPQVSLWRAATAAATGVEVGQDIGALPAAVSPCAAQATRQTPAGGSDARPVHAGVALVAGEPAAAAVVGIAVEINAVADAAVDVAGDAVG
jgi:hypothetical protein